MDYETVWSGNTWRSYPQPTVATTTGVVYTGERIDERLQQYSGRQLVFACLDNGGWHSVKGVIHRTGLSDRQVRMHLINGAKDGVLERMDGAPARQGLRPIFLYRRRQGAEQAA